MARPGRLFRNRGSRPDREGYKEALMFSKRIDWDVPLAVVELLARIGSVASITLLVLLFQGEAFNPSEIAPREWVGLFFFPIGVVVGMIVAWWKEGLGASVTLLSLLGFYFIYGYLLRYHLAGWAFVVFASPGLLFFLHWLFTHAEPRHAMS
jgi:hypothetical protein